MRSPCVFASIGSAHRCANSLSRICSREAAAGSVTAWRRYSAFGALIAGSDASERSFFGYDGEAQSPVTGLIYLRARHYDAASGRFGVADAHLGSAADPITQNRYLFCASDPVNHIDPSGHSLASLLSSGIANKFRGLRPNGGTPIAGNSFANLPGQITIGSELLPPSATRAQVKALANFNTSRWRSQQALDSGNTAAAAYHLFMAQMYQAQMRGFYCGSASAIQDWTYDRSVAIEYARGYTKGHDIFASLDEEFAYVFDHAGFRNPEYASFRENCANFVSQVLHEGGIPMTDEWHSYPNQVLLSTLGALFPILVKDHPGAFWDTTVAWSVASNQFKYLTDPANGYANGNVIDIYRSESASGYGGTNVAYSDLASRLDGLNIQPGDVMYFYDESGIHHSTVITKVEDETIYYSSNSIVRNDHDLANVIGSENGVLIVRLNDAGF